jgi:RNA polymerase sigma factor (sigma-70 family)
VPLPGTPMDEEENELLALEHTSDAPAADTAMAEPPGDPEFDRLYATYVPLLRRIAMRKFSIPREDVDPLIHDVFATYLTHSERVRELHPYLIGGICNAARRYWQKSDAERAVFCDRAPGEDLPDQALLDEVARSMDLRTVLGRLGPSCRELLYRFYIRGESASSIAESRSTTANSIFQILSYCRRSARAAFRSRREGAST